MVLTFIPEASAVMLHEPAGGCGRLAAGWLGGRAPAHAEGSARWCLHPSLLPTAGEGELSRAEHVPKQLGTRAGTWQVWG